MQRFDDDESKYCKAYIQYQCGLVSFFDTPRFVCTEILGNIWRHCIADGYKDQGKNIFYPHRRRISRKCLCAEGIYNCLHDHHTNRHCRLLENRWNSDPQHGTQLVAVKSAEWAIITSHPKEEDQKRQYGGNALGDQGCKCRTEHAKTKTGYHPKIHKYI